MKWLKRIVVGILAALALLALAAWLLTFTGVYQTWARGLILRTVEDRLNVQASVGRVVGNPLYRIRVNDLVLTRRGQPLLKAGHLSLSYFLPQVVFTTPVVGVTLADFELNIIRSAKGLNLAGLLKPTKGEAGGTKVVVSSLRLDGGKVLYTDETSPKATPTIVSDLFVEGRLGLPATPQQPLVFELLHASFKLNRPQAEVRSAEGTVRHGPQKTSLELKAQATVGGGELEAALDASGNGTSLESARASGRLDIMRYRPPAGPEVRGGVAFELAADTLSLSQGRLEAPGAEATLSGQVPGLSRIATPGLSAEAAGRLRVTDLAALSGRPALEGSAEIDYRLKASRGPKGELAAEVAATSKRATVAGFELQAASLAASWHPPALQIADLAATAKGLGRVKVSGPYEPGKALDLDFSAEASDLRSLATQLGVAAPVSGSATATGKLSGPPANPMLKGSFEARGLGYGKDLRASQASGTCKATNLFTGPKGRLSAQLSGVEAKGRKLEAVDFTTTLPQMGAVDFSGQVRESAQAIYRAQGTATGLGQPRQTINLASLEAELGQLRVRNTKPLPVVIGEGVVQLPQIGLAATDKTIEATGSATVPGAVNLALRFDNARLAELTRLIQVNFPLEGSLSGTTDVTGTTAEPRIAADLTARSGAISGIVFEQLSAKIDYAPQTAQIDARLTLPGAQSLSLKGSVPVKVTLMPPAIEASSGKGLLPGVAKEAVPGLLEKLFRGLQR